MGSKPDTTTGILKCSTTGLQDFAPIIVDTCPGAMTPAITGSIGLS
jgi:hypothetical protein